tara:strand:- start:10865 stop:11815 length:951 start_codon:yes stop_codon:yes gene_type:complete
MKIDVICTIYNEEKSIENLISSLLTQTELPNQIIIVDGGSTDQTHELVQPLCEENPTIKFVVDETCSLRYTNGAISRGRNIGRSYSTADFVIFVDAGCVYHKEWFSCFSKIAKQGEAIISGGTILSRNATIADKVFAPFLGFDQWNPYHTAYPTGTCRSLGIKTALFDELKGFNENANTGEDTDFISRATSTHNLKTAKHCAAIYTPDYNVKTALQRLFKYAQGDARFKQAKFRFFFMASRILFLLISIFSLFLNASLAFLGAYVISELLISIRRDKKLGAHMLDKKIRLAQYLASFTIPLTYILGYVSDITKNTK